jgi:hypothetical protein
MLSDPVRFFDSLIRGALLTLYDFVLLSLSGLLFPFVRHSKKFWRFVVSTNRRLSSLTLLLMWLFLFFSLIANDLPNLVTRVATNRDAGLRAIEIIAAAMLGTVLIDVVVRAFLMLAKGRTKRALYVELIRISVAGVFLLACAIMLAGEAGIFIGKLAVFGTPIAALMYLAGLSPSLVAAKALSIRNGLKRSVFISLGAFLAPILFIGGPVWAGYLLQVAIRPILTASEPAKVFQSNTRCDLVRKVGEKLPSQVKVTTFLKLDGETFKSAVLPSKILVVRRDNAEGVTVSVGKLSNTKNDVVLSSSSFSRVEILAEFLPEGNSELPTQESFECKLGRLDAGWFSSGEFEDQTVKSWR